MREQEIGSSAFHFLVWFWFDRRKGPSNVACWAALQCSNHHRQTSRRSHMYFVSFRRKAIKKFRAPETKIPYTKFTLTINSDGFLVCTSTFFLGRLSNHQKFQTPTYTYLIFFHRKSGLGLIYLSIYLSRMAISIKNVFMANRLEWFSLMSITWNGYRNAGKPKYFCQYVNTSRAPVQYYYQSPGYWQYYWTCAAC